MAPLRLYDPYPRVRPPVDDESRRRGRLRARAAAPDARPSNAGSACRAGSRAYPARHGRTISFARGAPSLDIVDVEGLREAAQRAFADDPAGTVRLRHLGRLRAAARVDRRAARRRARPGAGHQRLDAGRRVPVRAARRARATPWSSSRRPTTARCSTCATAAPTSTWSTLETDGIDVDALEDAARRRRAPEARAHHPQLPEPRRLHAERREARAAARARRRARLHPLRGRPLHRDPLRGRVAADDALAGRGRARSSTRRRSPRRSARASASATSSARRR